MAKGEGVRSDEHSPDLDQYAKDALDEVFSKEQQSYEEFLQGFLFLKKDDVTGMKAHSSRSSHSNTQNGLTCHDKNLKTSSDVVVQNSLSQKSLPNENDNIPEEVDNFVDCEDEVSDDDDDDDGDDGEKDNKKLHSFLEDDILSSDYSPSVLSISNSSESQEVEDSSTKDPHRKVDLDDESLKAAKEICYLSGDVSTLPGEVDDHETAEQQDTSCACKAVITPNIRQLQISTRINNCDKKNDDQNNLIEEDVGSDEVQPFTLDTDFDYNNVALTPKFSFVPKHVS